MNCLKHSKDYAVQKERIKGLLFFRICSDECGTIMHMFDCINDVCSLFFGDGGSKFQDFVAILYVFMHIKMDDVSMGGTN